MKALTVTHDYRRKYDIETTTSTSADRHIGGGAYSQVTITIFTIYFALCKLVARQKMGKSGKQTKANSKEQEQQSQEETNPYGRFTYEQKHSGIMRQLDFVDVN